MEGKFTDILNEFNKLSLEEQGNLQKALNAQSGELKGKVALVTGGNRGIGAAIVEKFTANGASVIFCSSKFNQKAKDFADQLKSTYGNEVIYVPCDVRVEKEIDAMINEAIDKFGRIDILVNNSGKAFIGNTVEFSLEDFEDCIKINLTGPFLFCKKVIPYMAKNKWGRIVNISSATTIKPQKALSAYMAAKSGLNSLTKGLALDVAEHNITVNNVLPGPTDTDMLKAGVSLYEECFGTSKEEILKEIVGGNAIKRPVDPKDIADTTYFLCREDACSVTGSNFSCDCGFAI